MIQFADSTLAVSRSAGAHVTHATTVTVPPSQVPHEKQEIGRNMSHPHDPIRLAELMRRASEAVKRDAPGPAKRYARAVGVEESRARRHKRSDDPYTPGVRMLAYVDALSRGDHTTAAAALAEAYAVYVEAMQDRPTQELEARLRECDRARIERQAALDHARTEEFAAHERWTLESANVDDARIALAEVDVEITAIRRELRDRAQREDR